MRPESEEDAELEGRIFTAATSVTPTTGGRTLLSILEAIMPVRVLDVPVDLAGTNDYLRSVFGEDGEGYTQRMVEKGLSPLIGPQKL